MAQKVMTPEANGDGTYLPMPWNGARRIERERLLYQEHQRLHHAQVGNYAAGWRRPSETTAARVWELVGHKAQQTAGRSLSAGEKQAFVVVLDAAIQAGHDGRLLTHNLVFDAVAAAWSDHYRAARERGPARVSWEMSADTLKGAWRDVSRNGIALGTLIHVAQNGCGLYTVTKGRDDKYKVKLTDGTQDVREKFLEIIAADGSTGGTYQRRGSMRRLRLAADPDLEDDTLLDEPAEDDDLSIEDATTRKVIAEVAYNVATPGARSMSVIRRLEATRLYLNAAAVEEEHTRLMDKAEAVFVEAYEKHNGVDLEKSTATAERTVIDAGTGKPRKAHWRSEWERHVREKLGRRPDPVQLRRVIALGRKYDKLIGPARQFGAIVEQVREATKAGRVDEYGTLKTRTRYAKLSNRRFQALDFWMTEVSGKQPITKIVNLGRAGVASGRDDDNDGPDIEVESTETTFQRGRLFSVAASTSAEERRQEFRRRERTWPHADVNDSHLDDRQDLVGFDVSGSQVQIYAFLLGLDKLEAQLKWQPYKEIAAVRAWDKHRDPRDTFKLPDDDYEGAGDPRLREAVKKATMTWLYGSPPAMIAERLAENPDEFGAGLGTPRNLALFLRDSKLQLDQITNRWKRACNKIVTRAWNADKYAGVTFTDPFDNALVRWNPVRWAAGRAAGSDKVRVYAKVPAGEKNEAGDFPVYRHRLHTAFGPCFIHTLDSMFCGFVIERLWYLGVTAVVAIHDAWYVPADAEAKLRDAVEAAGRPWYEALGGVYDDLERLLGTCTPPTRGKGKGKCCGYCGNWIQELREKWKARVEAGDWPVFQVGAVQSRGDDFREI
jgi:hypothetical protein